MFGGGRAWAYTERFHLEPLIESSSMLDMCILQPAYRNTEYTTSIHEYAESG